MTQKESLEAYPNNPVDQEHDHPEKQTRRNTMMSKMRNNKGFTLIELMIDWVVWIRF
jgi:hypothetical protein